MTNQAAIQQEVEWRLCSRDLRYFLENYWHIEHVQADKNGVFRKMGWKKFKLRDYQIEDLELIIKALDGDPDSLRQVWLKARQVGQTTLVVAAAFWDLYFHPDHSWLFAAQTEDDAKDTLLNRVKVPYSKLPEWMRKRGPQPVTDNTEELRFDNGSLIESIPATAGAGRGGSRYGMIMDEAAFVEVAAELYAAVGPQTYGPMFVFSTANGMGNWFHEIWLDSELADSEWIGNFHPWYAVPGRDERWYEREKRRMRNTPHLFYQEYPATPTEAFARSGRTALNIDLLDEQCWCEPNFRYDIALIDFHNEDMDAALEDAYVGGTEEADCELWVWEHPYVERDEDGYVLRDPNFVIFADVAEGLEHGDYSAVTVWDANTGEVVATMLAHYPVEDLGGFLEWLGYYYLTALIVVERNNNGLVVVVDLQRASYPRQYRQEKFGELPSDRHGKYKPRYGWLTNAATKPKMVHEFNKALADGQVVLHDARFRHEASTFVANGKGGFEAISGKHDDHVISHLGGWQGCLNVGAFPPVWQDRRPKPTTIGQVLQLSEPTPPSGLSTRIGQSSKGKPIVSFFVGKRES